MDSEFLSLTTMPPQLRRFAFALVHSTTKLLPGWFKVLEALKMGERKMPRDVTT
jgi:hypothetical protein